jgi:pyoverdine/dityrosine biosynthesis protein Dit1
MNPTTLKILDIFQGYRMAPTPNDVYESVGRSILADKLDSQISQGKVIDFVMLGFPFKSLSPNKVLGKLPDMGEDLTLKTFADFNYHVKSVYSPGVQISIASDGFIFSDLLGEQDSVVKQYLDVSKDMGVSNKAPMQWLTLDDFYTGNSIDSKRERIMSQFGITDEALTAEILTNPDVNYLYKGMTIFMTQELEWKNDYPSKSQLQKRAKALTRQMMMRNEAWSNLVKIEFKQAIRLSMHPSVNNGNKYSFQLIPGKNAHHSAWHSVVVESSGEHITMHKNEAVAAGYELVNKYGRPYYFQN